MDTQPFLLTAALLAVGPAAAQIVLTENSTFSVGSTAGDFPDGGSSPFSQRVSGLQIVPLTEV